MNRVFVCFLSALFCTFFLFSGVAFGEGFAVPALTGPVVDNANMIGEATEQKLTNALNALWQTREGQLVVLTVPNLGELTVESASIQIVDKWQLGAREKDNGLLLLIAKEDRALRIEVGQGFEGELPDAYAKRIIDETITPMFKAGKFDDGILLGVREILSKTNPKFAFDSYFQGEIKRISALNRDTDEGSIIPILFFVIFFVIPILRSLIFGDRYQPGFGFHGSGNSYRGGGGGGGFSGGGGGFSGGGASGKW